MSAKSVEIIPASGTEVLIPLNKFKKSPNNARKIPHSEAVIEAYAASIAAKVSCRIWWLSPSWTVREWPRGSIS